MIVPILTYAQACEKYGMGERKQKLFPVKTQYYTPFISAINFFSIETVLCPTGDARCLSASSPLSAFRPLACSDFKDCPFIFTWSSYASSSCRLVFQACFRNFSRQHYFQVLLPMYPIDHQQYHSLPVHLLSPHYVGLFYL